MAATSADAATIVYNVNQSILAGSVVGTISTDGTVGSITGADITAWNLLLTGAGGATYTLTNANSTLLFGGSDLTATTNNLFYNYDAKDGGFLGFQRNGYVYSGQYYYCNAAPGNFACAQGASVVPISYTDPSAQFEARTGNQIIATAPGLSGAVPEPAAWAMMLTGFGLAGAAMRRVRTSQPTFA